MSRQYDQHMSGKVEINGKYYSLVEPTNFKELIYATKVRNAILLKCNSLMHDDEMMEQYLDVLQEQEGYIDEYLKTLDSFDNTILMNNITNIAKEHGLRLGELESVIGISPGYLSRTVKSESKKKLSIDVVWRISQLFKIDIRTLLEVDCYNLNENTNLINKFLDRLTTKTLKNEIEWESHGGVLRFLKQKYYNMGLCQEVDGITIYHPNHLNQDFEWVLHDDIFACKDIDPNNEFVVIPFRKSNSKDIYFDFVFVNAKKIDEKNEYYTWEKAFYSEDDRYRTIRVHANELYEAILTQDCDAKMSKYTKQVINNFLHK